MFPMKREGLGEKREWQLSLEGIKEEFHVEASWSKKKRGGSFIRMADKGSKLRKVSYYAPQKLAEIGEVRKRASWGSYTRTQHGATSDFNHKPGREEFRTKK